MSSEHLASAKDHLKGDLGGSWNILEGASGQYPAPQIARRFGGASAAFSLRDIGANGTRVVTVRRDSDNATEDFSAEQITNGALAAFVGSGNNGYVNTWYDQSGNGNHATQSDTSEQPQIVDNINGVLDQLDFFGDNLRRYLDIGAFLGNGSGCTCFVVLSNVATGPDKYYVSNRGSTRGGFNFRNDGDPGVEGKLDFAFIGGGGSITSNDVVISNNSSTKQLIGFARNGNTVELYNNGAQLATNSDSRTYVTAEGTLNTSLGKQGSSAAGSGAQLRMGEIVIYDADISADRSAIESDIASYWGITLS